MSLFSSLSLFHQSRTQILEKKIYVKSRGMNQNGPRRLTVFENFINRDLIVTIIRAYKSVDLRKDRKECPEYLHIHNFRKFLLTIAFVLCDFILYRKHIHQVKNSTGYPCRAFPFLNIGCINL